MLSDPWEPYIIGKEGYPPTGGFIPKIITKVFEQLENVELKMTLMPWARALKLVQTGHSDGLMMVIKNKEREKYLDYTAPLIEGKTKLVYMYKRFPQGIEWNSLGDLGGYRIGVLTNTNIERLLLQAIEKGAKFVVDPVPNDRRNFDKLLYGRIQLIAINEFFAQNYIHEAGLQDQIGIVEKPIYTAFYHMAFSKKSPARHLIPKINQSIHKLKAAGFIEQAYSSTHTDAPQKSPLVTP